MKIAHLINYISADGAFGGPTAVATAQMQELASRGHEVVLIAGWDGAAEVSVKGVTSSLHRSVNALKRGFSGMLAPGTWPKVIRNARNNGILHVHFGRDISSIASSFLHIAFGGKLICQTHGMVMPKTGVAARIVDTIAVRPILRRAEAVLVLTDDEERGLLEVGRGRVVIRRLGNGLRNQIEKRPVSQNEVLFLARLHPRKRVMAFATAATILAEKLPNVRFVVVGPDEGDLNLLEQYIDIHDLSPRLTYEGSLPPGKGVARIARASVYVLPSYGEVFPMSVLEALSVGTPVITTSDSGIAQLLDEKQAATIVNGTPESIADAIQSHFLNPDEAKKKVQAGHKLIDSKFSIIEVVDELEKVYTANLSAATNEGATMNRDTQ